MSEEIEFHEWRDALDPGLFAIWRAATRSREIAETNTIPEAYHSSLVESLVQEIGESRVRLERASHPCPECQNRAMLEAMKQG